MRSRNVFLVLLSLCYGLLFTLQERHVQQTTEELSYPLPGIIQKAVLGYLGQLGGEMSFIKTAVFLGENFTNNQDYVYADRLASNFNVMAELHPYFIDIYYLCEASLPYLGAEWAHATNTILDVGITANPDKWVLPFFKSYNYNHILDDPQHASQALIAASKIDSAPDWIGHLASIRAVQGGDILAGLIWLKAMLNTEKDLNLQKRYEQDIEYFEQALKVQKAILNYRKKYMVFPKTLADLVPEYLSALPDLGRSFLLEWEPPNLKMKRPNRKRSR